MYVCMYGFDCCASGIHLLIILRNLPDLFKNLGHGSTCCVQCHHKAKAGRRDAGVEGEEARQSLLSQERYADDGGDGSGEGGRYV